MISPSPLPIARSRGEVSPRKASKAKGRDKAAPQKDKLQENGDSQDAYDPRSQDFYDDEFALYIPKSNESDKSGTLKRAIETSGDSQSLKEGEGREEEADVPLRKKPRKAGASSSVESNQAQSPLGWKHKSSSNNLLIDEESNDAAMSQSLSASAHNGESYISDAQPHFNEADFEETRPFTQFTYGPQNSKTTSLRFGASQERLESLLRDSLTRMCDSLMRAQELFVARLPQQPNDRFLQSVFTNGPRVTDILSANAKNRSHAILNWPVDQFYTLVYQAWYIYYWSLQESVAYMVPVPAMYLPSFPDRTISIADGSFADMGTLSLRMSRIIELGYLKGYTKVDELMFHSTQDHKAWDERIEDIDERLESLNSKIETLVESLDIMVKDIINEKKTKK